jgi:hypothetical protein
MGGACGSSCSEPERTLQASRRTKNPTAFRDDANRDNQPFIGTNARTHETAKFLSLEPTNVLLAWHAEGSRYPNLKSARHTSIGTSARTHETTNLQNLKFERLDCTARYQNPEPPTVIRPSVRTLEPTRLRNF